MRRGWTLHEMVVSLGVMALVLGLTSHLAVGQLRFFRGAGDVAAVRGQLHEVAAIASAALWGVSPARGDVLFASDSALEVRVPTGIAAVCEGGVGQAAVPAPEPVGNTLSGFDEVPAAGDAASLLIADTVAAVWVRVTLASSPTTAAGCAAMPAVTRTWRLSFVEPLVIPTGAVLRLARPVRLSLYRASDGRWYMGVRDWSVAAGRLNTIQPAAGPLHPYNPDPGRSGLAFRYYDASAAELHAPLDAERIARIDVSARSASLKPVKVAGLASSATGAFVDSVTATIALRNRP